MKIKWWGHASFLITASDGTRTLTDPYDEELPYAEINDRADYVTVSHSHYDHNAVGVVPGNPRVVDDVKGYKDEKIKIEGISSYHDDAQGSKRGENIIFKIELEGIKVCHMGDLGHLLNEEQVERLSGVDILLIPVGGNYTINAEQASKILEVLNPPVVIPMHYKTDILDFPIKGVDEFTKLFTPEKVEKIDGSEVEIEEIPSTQKVYILDYV